jgi:site-specific recombinase XerD
MMLTVEDLAPVAIAAISPNSRRTYRTGIRRLVADLGDRPLDTVTLADLESIRDRARLEVGTRTVQRARSSGRRLRSYDPDAYGRGAAENFVSATRFFFGRAVAGGHLADSPAKALRAPARPQPPERPLEPDELEDMWRVASTTGRDTPLDTRLLQFLRHTAARREGCLNLALDHLHRRRGTVTLTEKYGQSREQPLARAQLADLAGFAIGRGASGPGDAVFRYRDGTPMTRRRFASLFDRMDRQLSWTQPLDVGAHWIRHTTLADIAAASDVRVAAAFAGHRPEELGVIGRYTQVTFADLVAAYEAVFGSRG